MTQETVLPSQLLIQLITTYSCQVIATRIIEEIIEKGGTTFFGSRFTRTKFVIDFNKSRLSIYSAIFFQSLFDMNIMIKKVQNIIIGRITKSTNQYGHWHFTVSIDTDRKRSARIRFQFNPGTTVWNELCGINFLTESIFFLLVVHARRTNQLRYDDTFSTIDNECACIGHNREIAHEQIMFLEFASFFIFQTNLNVQRCRIIDILCFALFNIVLAFAEVIITKMECPFVCTILDRGNICKYIFEPFPAEPFIRFRLQVEQMGHLQYFL